MDRRTFLPGEAPDEGEFNGLEDDIEKGIARQAAMTAGSVAMPWVGLLPSPVGGMAIGVSAGMGYGMDAGGLPRLIRDPINDSIDVSASVPNAQSVWCLVGLQRSTLDSDARPDVTQNTTPNTRHVETSILVAILGAVGGNPSKPTVPVDVVPIVDVLLTAGMNTITAAMLDTSRCRPVYGKPGIPGGPMAQLADVIDATSNSCRVVASEPATMDIIVRAGSVSYQDVFVPASQQTLTLIAPAAGNVRLALVWMDRNGTATVSYGASIALGGTPVAPSHIGRASLAEVLLFDSTTYVPQLLITDVRAFVSASRDVPSRTTFTAAGGETSVATSAPYVAGTAMVWRTPAGGGDTRLLVDGVEYNEDAAHQQIVGLAALGAGDRIDVLAPMTGGANPVITHAPSHGADGPDAIDYSTLGGLVAPGFEAFSTGDNALTIKPFAAIISGRMRKATGNVNLAAEIANGANCDGGVIASGWRYIYAYWTGSAVAVEVSVVAPDAQLRLKSSDVTRTYLCPLRFTGGAVKLRCFRKKNRRISYNIDYTIETITGDAQCGCIGTWTGNQLGFFDASPAVPPHVGYADILVQCTGGGGSHTTITSDVGTPQSTNIIVYDLGVSARQPVFLKLSPGSSIGFQGNQNTTKTIVWVAGYEE